MKIWLSALMISALSLTGVGSAAAAGFSWSNHATPFTFLFGNDIDTHQQTHLGRDGNLFGFLYITFTGETTVDGYRVATHGDCNAAPRCTVGWLMRGRPGNGTFLYHVMGDHPVWLVNRSDIPQPGGYSHFHWLGAAHPNAGEKKSGYFLELVAIDFFCFVHPEHGAMAMSTGGSCQDHGGVVVTPGLDIATHTNVVTSFPSDM